MKIHIFLLYILSYKQAWTFNHYRIPQLACCPVNIIRQMNVNFNSRKSFPSFRKISLEIYSEENPTIIGGEDAASFSLKDQRLESWGVFSAAVAVVLGFVTYMWIWPEGPQLGNSFKNSVESFAGGDSTLAIVLMLGFFAICHSGLASLRPIG